MVSWRDDLYLVLGVERTADSAEILAAYRQMIRQSSRMSAAGGNLGGGWRTRVDKAYEVLSDPLRRAEYDNLIR